MVLARRVSPFVPAVLLALLPAQEPPADPLALIATAERRLQRQAPDEDATLLLWQAAAALHELTPGAARDAAAATVAALLPKADPLATERERAQADAARRILAIAQAYRSRRWFDAADDCLALAVRLDEAGAQKEVQALGAARGRDAPAAGRGRADERPLIARLQADNSGGAWTVEQGELVAPSPSPKGSNLWFLTTTTHADAEISVEIRITDVQGIASLVFGSHNARDQFRATLERRAADDWALRCECDGHAQEIQVVDGRPEPTPDGWHRLVVRVRDKLVQMQIDGGPMSLGSALPRSAHGKIGFIVYGMDEAQPIRFRNLTIGPLPELTPDAAAVAAEAEAKRRERVLAAVTAGEKLLADKQPEAAMRALRLARTDAAGLPTGTLRDNLLASIEKVLARSDSLHGRRERAAREAADRLGTLAAAYRDAGRLRCALAVLDEVRDLDAAAGAGLRADVEAALTAQAVAEAAARAQELAAPDVDDAALQAAFAGARPLFHKGHPWTVDAAGARVTDLRDQTLTGLLGQGLPATGGRFVVHVHLPQIGGLGGFAFDARGDNDYGVVLLRRSAQRLTLSVQRFHLGRWQLLARQHVPVPAWRTSGWFELRLDAAEGRVLATCGDVELTVPRDKLGAAGPVGLCAGVSGPGPADVVFRGFRQLGER